MAGLLAHMAVGALAGGAKAAGRGWREQAAEARKEALYQKHKAEDQVDKEINRQIDLQDAEHLQDRKLKLGKDLATFENDIKINSGPQATLYAKDSKTGQMVPVTSDANGILSQSPVASQTHQVDSKGNKVVGSFEYLSTGKGSGSGSGLAGDIKLSDLYKDAEKAADEFETARKLKLEEELEKITDEKSKKAFAEVWNKDTKTLRQEVFKTALAYHGQNLSSFLQNGFPKLDTGYGLDDLDAFDAKLGGGGKDGKPKPKDTDGGKVPPPHPFDGVPEEYLEMVKGLKAGKIDRAKFAEARSKIPPKYRLMGQELLNKKSPAFRPSEGARATGVPSFRIFESTPEDFAQAYSRGEELPVEQIEQAYAKLPESDKPFARKEIIQKGGTDPEAPPSQQPTTAASEPDQHQDPTAMNAPGANHPPKGLVVEEIIGRYRARNESVTAEELDMIRPYLRGKELAEVEYLLSRFSG